MMDGMTTVSRADRKSLADPFPVIFDPPLHRGECDMIGNFVDRLKRPTPGAARPSCYFPAK